MRRALAPILFDDDDQQSAEATRSSVVAPAPRSERAQAKDASKHSEDGAPVQSFQSLLGDLATITKNRVQPTAVGAAFDMLTTPTALQQRALNLLGVSCNL
jgi:hypothetical protein